MSAGRRSRQAGAATALLAALTRALALAVRMAPISASLLAAGAQATEPGDLSCEPAASPAANDQAVPRNSLLFGFGTEALADSAGRPLPTAPAPAPWDNDSRYRVPLALLSPQATYTVNFQLQVSEAAGSFTTGTGLDDQPPTAPGALWFAQARDPGRFAKCASDRALLIGLRPSADDQAGATALRYDLARQLADGGLAMVDTELQPVALTDGGLVLAVIYGLEGLPGSYVLQARDQAGNLSEPSAPLAVDIGPGCTFASSTTGRRGASPLLCLLALVGWRRGRRASVGPASPTRPTPPAER